jgi:uncharacterized BrkB/YihY/UPF0761 family membrane protein
MPSEIMPNRAPRWYLVPVRVVIVVVIVTLLAFAIGLLLGICGVVLWAKLHGVHPDLRLSYRYIAFPAAALVAAIALATASFMEVRDFRRARSLYRLERQMGHT